jgi:hypothetical protein
MQPLRSQCVLCGGRRCAGAVHHECGRPASLDRGGRVRVHPRLLRRAGHGVHAVRGRCIQRSIRRMHALRRRHIRQRVGGQLDGRVPELWGWNLLNRCGREPGGGVRGLSTRHILGCPWGHQPLRVRAVRRRHFRDRAGGHRSHLCVPSLRWWDLRFGGGGARLHALHAGDVLHRLRCRLGGLMQCVSVWHLWFAGRCDGVRTVHHRDRCGCTRQHGVRALQTRGLLFRIDHAMPAVSGGHVFQRLWSRGAVY